MDNFKIWREQKVNQIESWLNQQMSINSLINNKNKFTTDQKLLQAMAYSLLDGGKRLRAILVYAGGECVKAKVENVNYLAGSVEAVHAYSLIHDDLPCMDNDDLRRGRPTCHKVYGEALALLAGDGLHALAFEWILNLADFNDVNAHSKIISILKLLSNSIGYNGMVGGQAIDIELTTNPPKSEIINNLENMHSRKTGALIKASFLAGILAGEKYNCITEVPIELIKYCEVLGLLFQVVDDYLDATEDSQTLGKTAGKDEKSGKTTYVTILGLEKTRDKINSLLEEINGFINTLKNDITPQCAKTLTDIALWVARRNK